MLINKAEHPCCQCPSSNKGVYNVASVHLCITYIYRQIVYTEHCMYNFLITNDKETWPVVLAALVLTQQVRLNFPFIN